MAILPLQGSTRRGRQDRDSCRGSSAAPHPGGGELLLTLDEVGFRVTTYRQAIRQAQSLFAKLKGEGESVVEELLRERRDEAAKEEREFRERYARE